MMDKREIDDAIDPRIKEGWTRGQLIQYCLDMAEAYLDLSCDDSSHGSNLEEYYLGRSSEFKELAEILSVFSAPRKDH